LSVASAGVSANDRITVQVTPSDGTLTGTAFTSNTITIATASPAVTLEPPTVTGVIIAPNSATAAAYLVAQPSASADPLGLPLQGAYQWLENNQPIPGATSDFLLLGAVSNLAANEKFSVRVTANDGYLTSPTFTSNPVTLATVKPNITLNAPTIQTFTIAADNRNNATELNATITSNSPTGYNFQWFQNSSAISGATSMTLNLALLTVKPGDVFQLQATPVEGPLSGTPVLSNVITIQSIGPIVTN
jgi:hypothetical protein